MKYRTKMKINPDTFSPYLDFFRKRRRIIILICTSVILIAVVQGISTTRHDDRYVRDKEGVICALRIDSEKEALSLPLEVTARKKGVTVKLETVLTFRKEKKADSLKRLPSTEENLKKALRDVAAQVESQKGTRIRLPSHLDDGTELIWSDSDTTSLPTVFLLLPLGLLFLYQYDRQKEKEAVRRKTDDIRRQLPAFNSQILLLLGSGMIFHDAFARISDGYKRQNNGGYLAQVIQEIHRETDETGSSLITVLSRYSKELGVREFTRISGIIADNQHKGVSLTEKLEKESEILWNQRKKLAEEKGRTAETKLSFPLAVLLLVLVLVTASPAILQM